jgi:hypothetical protein
MPRRPIPLEGRTFGRWTVVEAAGIRNNRAAWRVRCDCGAEKVLGSNVLIHGKSKSCGCLKIEVVTKHGHARDSHTTPTYQAWEGMIQRCTNPRAKKFADYGGRGITVCERWRDFTNFLADMGERPDGMELDRIDNDGPYSPENCRYATRAQQTRNKRNNRLVTFNGETLCLMDWSARTGISFPNLRYRIESGWSAEKALTTPGGRGGTPEHGKAIGDALRGRTLSDEHRANVSAGMRRSYATGNDPRSRMITFQGETKSLTDWSRTVGISFHTLLARLRLGWTTERAFTTPVRRKAS